jgi:SAM-dependent methyltransferase
MNDPKEYVLTTSAPENARLRRQHDLWLEDTRNLWRRARFSRSQSLLELGSGPGYTTLDLARYLGPTCDFTAIELSPNYAEECKQRLKDYPNVKVLTANLLEIDLGHEKFDGIFGRWIWMFLPNVEFAVEKIVKSLKRGGTLAIQEYVNYQAMSLSPNSMIHDTVVEAVMKSFRDSGGEPDVVKKLIPLFEENGMEVEVLEPVGKLIRPSDPFWDWPSNFFATYLQNLEENRYLSRAQIETFRAEWAKAEKQKGTFWIGPTVANVIARKK